MDVSQTKLDELREAVTVFMNANYPCSCSPDDDNCPKESFEAGEIVNITKQVLNLNTVD